MTLTKATLKDSIEALEALGFSRWTKAGMDRMYINASDLGLTCAYYHTGNIKAASFDGETISNAQGYRLKSAKTYIDLNKALIVSDDARLARKVAEMVGIEATDSRCQYTIA